MKLQEQGAGDVGFTHPTSLMQLQEQGAGDVGSTHPTSLMKSQFQGQCMLRRLLASREQYYMRERRTECILISDVEINCGRGELQMTGTAELETSQPADHVGVTTMELLDLAG